MIQHALGQHIIRRPRAWLLGEDCPCISSATFESCTFAAQQHSLLNLALEWRSKLQILLQVMTSIVVTNLDLQLSQHTPCQHQESVSGNGDDARTGRTCVMFPFVRPPKI